MSAGIAHVCFVLLIFVYFVFILSRAKVHVALWGSFMAVGVWFEP